MQVDGVHNFTTTARVAEQLAKRRIG
jgi:hypothetical protein